MCKRTRNLTHAAQMNSVVLLLLVAGINTLDATPDYSFWARVPSQYLQPCVDFSNAVCDNKTSVVMEMMRDYQKQLYRAFENLKPDNVTQELYSALKMYDRKACLKTQSSMPRVHLGQLIAYGLTDLSVKVHPDAKTIEVRLKNRTATVHRRKFDFAPIRMPFNDLPNRRLKKLVSDYMRTIDIDKRFNVANFDVIYEKDVVVYIQEKDSFKSSFPKNILDLPDTVNAVADQSNSSVDLNDTDDMIRTFQNTNFLAAYSNLLIASQLLKVDPNLVHNRGLVRKLRTITQDILEQIELDLEKVDWLSQSSKEKLKRLHTIDDFGFGAPETFLNQTMVRIGLTFYQNYFRKHSRFNFPRECDVLHHAMVFRAADQSFQLYYGYDFGQFHDLLGYSFFFHNAGNYQDTKLIFGMPFIYGFDKALPLEYIYGSIGFFIGHEIFHSYGIKEIVQDNLHDVLLQENYQKAKECLTDYYGSFVGPDGTKPNGTFKAGEGFADIHSARMIARLVKRITQKRIQGKKYLWREAPKKRQKMETDNALQLALTALAESFCPYYLNEQDNEEEQLSRLKTDRHPRNTIRVNAIVKQVAEFTDAFHCRQDEQLFYESEKACDAFPIRPQS